MKLLLKIFCQAPFSAELKTENLTEAPHVTLIIFNPQKLSLTLKGKPNSLFTFLIFVFSRDILVQPAAESMHCVGVAISAWPDQSCPKNQDKWIANQKQTHLFLGETFQWNVWSSRNITQISAIKLKLFLSSKQRTPFHLDKNTSHKNLHCKLDSALTSYTFKGWTKQCQCMPLEINIHSV